MYFELIKEVIRYILNTGYNKKNLEALNIINNNENITKDKLLSYLDYLFSFTTNFYKKKALQNILNNFEVYYQIQRVLIKSQYWKEEKTIVFIKDNYNCKFIDKYKTYEEASAKVLWLLAEDKRLNKPNIYKYNILGYMSYIASDVEYLSSLSDCSLLEEQYEDCISSNEDYFKCE